VKGGTIDHLGPIWNSHIYWAAGTGRQTALSASWPSRPYGFESRARCECKNDAIGIFAQ
jgi:hypothetical protein